MKRNLAFIVITTLSYSLAYLLAGAIAYQLITKQFYVGDHALFNAYLRSETNIAEWTHTNIWILPVVILRGLLLSLVLIPFRSSLEKFSFRKKALILALFIFIAAHIAAAAPSPSNLEGFVYMKPSLFTLKAFLLTQPEMIMQALGFGMLTAVALKKYSEKHKHTN